MLETAVTILIEALFTLVFLGVLIDYLRDRDPLTRDVVLVFGSVAGRCVSTSTRTPGSVSTSFRSTGAADCGRFQ